MASMEVVIVLVISVTEAAGAIDVNFLEVILVVIVQDSLDILVVDIVVDSMEELMLWCIVGM